MGPYRPGEEGHPKPPAEIITRATLALTEPSRPNHVLNKYNTRVICLLGKAVRRGRPRLHPINCMRLSIIPSFILSPQYKPLCAGGAGRGLDCHAATISISFNAEIVPDKYTRGRPIHLLCFQHLLSLREVRGSKLRCGGTGSGGFRD